MILRRVLNFFRKGKEGSNRFSSGVKFVDKILMKKYFGKKYIKKINECDT